ISAYLHDKANGATLLTIPVGHTLAAVTSVLGEVASVSAVLETRWKTTFAEDTKENIPTTTPDQVLANGLLASGAPISLHFRGGVPRDGEGLRWTINGRKGDIRITGALGHTQFVALDLKEMQGDAKAWTSIETPTSYDEGLRKDPVI